MKSQIFEMLWCWIFLVRTPTVREETINAIGMIREKLGGLKGMKTAQIVEEVSRMAAQTKVSVRHEWAN